MSVAGLGSSVPLLTMLAPRRSPGLQILIQTGHGSDRQGPVHPLGDDPLGAKPASMFEHGRPIPGEVFVEKNARLGIAQQSRQRSLPVEKRVIASSPSCSIRSNAYQDCRMRSRSEEGTAAQQDDGFLVRCRAASLAWRHAPRRLIGRGS
jgi:hypothetical protein